METKSIEYILNAIEDLRDYIPLLERQNEFNQVIVSHSVDALQQIFTQYKHEIYYENSKQESTN